MSKPFIIVTDGMDKELFEILKNEKDLDVYPKSKVTQEELKPLLARANGLIIRSATNPDKAFLDQCPNLKLIIRAGEGTDNIDKKYCAEKNIKVANTPGANNNSAAEHAFALMMTVLRKTAHANQSMHKGEWEKTAFTGNELWKKNVGIVGFGRIGQIFCKRLQGFEPNVTFFDPFVQKSTFDYAKKTESLDEIFKNSDIISIHMPLIDQTKNLITAKYLNMMKPSAILINAARGKIVNEDDLYTLLKEKKIKGAGFDVFAQEPIDKASKLLELDNLVMSPHLGASTEEAQFRVGEMSVFQAKEFFLNHNLLNEVKA